ncbi:DUF6975 family protein [Sphingomonas sp.]|uniref:DUF6975 family protein n=1 Tax=Sphingomonas sp. TaxID=28214 RepID=UPI002C1FE3F3|nr:hypothetical protein [Sphingomonas sp.]HTG38724.1 hypothetical protein [Sphingomonas sp.]
MATTSLGMNGNVGATAAIVGLLHTDGTRSHRHAILLTRPDAQIRDLADALHLIGMLHGRHPGLFDHALAHGQPDAVIPWLTAAAQGFAGERHWLTTLVAAVGPLPSTPGQAESEAAVSAQRHALDTLVQSDRIGCAVGAAAALALDWTSFRELLNGAAVRLGMAIHPATLPSAIETAIALDDFAASASVQRATRFGAQQLLAQHHCMWDLLEARASARNDG